MIRAPQYGIGSGPTKPDPAKSCYSKRRYPTEKKAKRYAARQTYFAKPYACFVCGGYHLASRTD